MHTPRRLAAVLLTASLLATACEKAAEQGEASSEPTTTTAPETSGQPERDEAAAPDMGEKAPGVSPTNEPPAETPRADGTSAVDPGLEPAPRPAVGSPAVPMPACASVIYAGPAEQAQMEGLPTLFQALLCDDTTLPLMNVPLAGDHELGTVELVDWTLLEGGGYLFVLYDGADFQPVAWPGEGSEVMVWPPIVPGQVEVEGGQATEHLAVVEGHQIQVYADASSLSPDDDVVQRYGRLVPTRTVAAAGSLPAPRASALHLPEACPTDDVELEGPGGDPQQFRVTGTNATGARVTLFDEAGYDSGLGRHVRVERWCEPALTFVRDQTEGQMHVTETVTVFDASGEQLHRWQDVRLGTERALPRVSADGRYLVFDGAARGWVYDLKGRKVVFEAPDHGGSTRYGWHGDEGDDGVPDKAPLPAGAKFVFLPRAS